MATRKYHKTVDYLILAAELLHQNKPNSASKALLKATLLPGSRKALADLDSEQQDLQDQDIQQDAAPTEESVIARSLARALSLEVADDQQDDQDFGGDQDDQEADVIDPAAAETTEAETEETADEVDLENVELEADDTDGQLMRDSVDKPAIDTTKASVKAKAAAKAKAEAKAAVVAKNLRASLQKRFAAKKAAKK